MPKQEEYGAQPPIELLRQFMDYNGWFDLSDQTFRTLISLQFLAAMGPPGGGRNQVTQRYLLLFNLTLTLTLTLTRTLTLTLTLCEDDSSVDPRP
eukprot:7950291-Pyramimonas_sp.AAC.1